MVVFQIVISYHKRVQAALGQYERCGSIVLC